MRHEIRLARAQDARGIAVVHVDTWRSTYRGLLAASTLEKLSYDQREARWKDILALSARGTTGFTLVAEALPDGPAGSIVGFASGGTEREGDPLHKGELTALYVLAASQGHGLGRKLIVEVARRLRASGFESLLVWVLAGNPAAAFYQHMGGVEVKRKQAEIGGAFYEEIAYGWRSVETLLAGIDA